MEPPPSKIRKSSQAHLPSPDEVITEKDLPMLANIGDVRVHHYLMKLSTNFSTRVVNGSVILFLEWLNPAGSKIILDKCFLKFKSVVLLKTGKEYDVLSELSKVNKCSDGNRKYFYRSNQESDWFENHDSMEELSFTQSKWSITIQGWKGDPPTVLKIDYETLETSPSIHWRPCDGFNYQEASSKCCYTPAPAVNNRGLFPCQELPSAMATWEVLLECEKDYIPLLTSDEPGEVIKDTGEDKRIHYFYCSIPLPMSTFAMVVGKFYLQTDLVTPSRSSPTADIINEKSLLLENSQVTSCQHHTKYPCRFGDVRQRHEKLIPVRLFCLDPDTVPQDLRKFTSLVDSSLTTSFDNFGPHPFSRLDIVIVPKSYPHLGLTSPSMIFLSPNNFYGEEPMYVCRLPHEICHSWFGLLIGSLDWSEEWLSEGFATYCEDILFPTAYGTYFPNKSTKDIEHAQALKILARFTSLINELHNTSDELHIISSGNLQENSQSTTNGLVPIKQFMHVHYYKGYLLLWHLASLVGQHEFLNFLKEYVLRYHGQLVTSEMFLECYHTHFEGILCYQDCETIMMNLKKEWLQSNKLPEPYNSLDLLGDDNLSEDSVPPLFTKVLEPLKNVKIIVDNLLQGKAASESESKRLENLTCSELLLLMEFILKALLDESCGPEKRTTLENIYFQKFVTSKIFEDVEQRYNADVAHRWCELIIAFKDKARLHVVEKFLRNNISMGVYLYGELMITERYAFQEKAKQLYYELQGVYDLNTKKILKEMIF